MEESRGWSSLFCRNKNYVFYVVACLILFEGKEWKFGAEFAYLGFKYLNHDQTIAKMNEPEFCQVIF